MRPFHQGAELGPGHLGVDLVARARGAEAAVGAGDDVFASQQACEALDALGHELGVLDQVHAMGDHAGDEDLALGELRVAPDGPLVLVPRIGGFDEIGAGLHAQQEVDEMPELEVERARRHVDAIAGVKADALFGEPAQRVVHRLDALGDEAAALLDIGIHGAVVVRRHARVVDLQEKSGLDDGPVFDAHRISKRRQVRLA